MCVYVIVCILPQTQSLRNQLNFNQLNFGPSRGCTGASLVHGDKLQDLPQHWSTEAPLLNWSSLVVLPLVNPYQPVNNPCDQPCLLEIVTVRNSHC